MTDDRALLEAAANPTTYIQWKGTDLCMDFWCPSCKGNSHFDGMFAYHIKCPHCGDVFKMPEDVPVVKVEEKPGMMILEGEP